MKLDCITFKEINRNILFSTGKRYNTGIAKDIYGLIQKEVFKKLSDSTGICIDQIGYGNKRQIGTIRKFNSNKKVFIEL